MKSSGWARRVACPVHMGSRRLKPGIALDFWADSRAPGAFTCMATFDSLKDGERGRRNNRRPMDDMKAAMKRRALLCFGGQVILTTPFLAACTSAPCVSSNELDAARCREQAVKDSAPMYITGA